MERNAPPAPPHPAKRRLWTFAIGLVVLLVFLPSLKAAISLALSDERYLQIILAPFGCAILIFRQRREIFAQSHYSPCVGIPLLACAILLGIAFPYRFPGSESTGLLLSTFAMALALMAGFILCFGLRSFRAAIYPLCCLFVMIPLLPSWMDRVAAALQHGSAAISYEILRLTGIPVLRRGMLFSLPGLTVEVGLECSGIRSSLAMIMVAIVAGYVYLRSGWARSALILLTIPIVLFKNSVRIVTISTLAAYVDRVFLDGPFHHRYGGLLFTVLGVSLFALVLAGLQKIERRRPDRTADQPQPGRASVITERQYSRDSWSVHRP